MVMSFSEFNRLYESYNGDDSYYGNDGAYVYSNGIDIMESLLATMYDKGTLTETEVVTFLDIVLENTGWELNDAVYENYEEWLNDWSPFIDEGLNESTYERVFAITNRGQMLLEEETTTEKKVKEPGKIMSAIKGAGTHIASTGKGVLSGGKKVFGAAPEGAKGFAGAKAKYGSLTGHEKAGLGIAGAAGAAALGYGAYKGVKALKARKAAKAQQAQQAQQQQGR